MPPSARGRGGQEGRGGLEAEVAVEQQPRGHVQLLLPTFLTTTPTTRMRTAVRHVWGAHQR